MTNYEIRVRGKDCHEWTETCKSRAEARARCAEWNGRFKLLRSSSPERASAYRYANAIILGEVEA